MVHWSIGLLAMATSCLALYFNLRLKKNYFLDSKFFLAVANTGFILVLVQNMVSELANVPSSITLFVLLNGFMAASLGFASFLLERSGGGTGIRELTGFLSKPPRTFTVYLGIVVSWTLLSVLLQPFQLQQAPGPEGTLYYYTYDSWWLAFSAVLVGSFFAGPVYSLYRQSLRVRDAKAVRSMRILVFSWTGFGIMGFFQGTAGSLAAFTQDIGAIVTSFLFILVSLALKEPTFLSRVLAGGEAVSRAVYSSDGDTIVLYNMDSDRRKLVDGIAREELADGRDVVCFVPKADVPLYTAILRGAGRQGATGQGEVDIQSIETVLSAVAETNTLHPGFSRSKRELIDLGELDSSTSQRVIAKVRAMDALPGPARAVRIWAMKVESSDSGLVNEIRDFTPKARVIDLAGQQDSFSKLLDMEHQKLLGSRVLLEYDPSSNFEDVVLKFAREFQANVEPVAIFTSMGSPVYWRVKGQHSVLIFSSSTKTSTPLRVSQEEVLLPERDTSLLLDAVDKLLQAYPGRSVGIAIDILTDLILSQGFEKTYGVFSSVAEMAESEYATVLVLVNSAALEERVLNGIRGLFRFQIRFDAEGLKRVRVPDAPPRRVEELPSMLGGQSVPLGGS